MKIIHISDTNLNLSFPILNDTPNKLIIEVKNNHRKAELFLIYVNYKADNIARADNAGILLLKYLRLNHFTQHCVLYSFLSREQLMIPDPYNSIIFSEGVTFIRLPKDLSSVNYDELVNKKAPDNLSEYFRGEIDLSQIRHSLANIYGLRLMSNIHNKHFPARVVLDDNHLIGMSEKPSCLQLAIADYLLLNKSAEGSEKHIIIDKINNLQRGIEAKHPNILYIDDKADLGWANFLKKAILRDKDAGKFITKTPRKQVFSSDEKFNEFFRDINKVLCGFDPLSNCILLDLRLADEMGEIDDLDKLSGIRLLKKIHETYPAIPVIIFTASNKAKSVKKIIECGAEALWTKPGIEDVKNESIYLDAYCELMNYLFTALHKYKTTTEKNIITAQFKAGSKGTYPEYPEEFKDVDIILTDTNIWLGQGNALVKNHILMQRLLNVNGPKKIEIIVIEDVLQELYIKAKAGETTELKITAQYALDTIWKYMDKKMISTGYRDIQEVSRQYINWGINKLGTDLYQVVSNVKRIHKYYNRENEAKTDICKNKNKRKTNLHADDTFSMLIPYYIKNKGKNVVFLSNDRESWGSIISSIDKDHITPRRFYDNRIYQVNVGNRFCRFGCGKAFKIPL